MLINKPFFGRSVTIRTDENDSMIYDQCISQSQSYIPSITLSPRYIIDAGAHIGLSSLLYTYHYRKAIIIALEPDRENFDLLVENTKTSPNIRPLLGGLWNRRCFLSVSDPDYKGKCGLITQETSQPDIEGYAVPDLMLLYSFRHVDILKIDIEGAETVIFDHRSLEWLPKVNSIIIEVHGDSRWFFDFMDKTNFTRPILEGEHYRLTNRSQT